VVTDTAGTGNLRLDVINSNFSANSSAGIASNANGGNLQTNITGNTIVEGAGNQFRALSGGTTSTGNFFFNVDNNTLTSNNGGAGVGPSVIAYANIGSGNLNGTINNNIITNNTPTGVTSVSGISAINNGSGSSFVAITGNTINVNDGFGLIANTQGTISGSGHFTITNNNVPVSGTDIINTAISLENSSTAGTECVNISGNTVSTAPVSNVDIVINNSAAGVFQVQQTAVASPAPFDFLPNNQQVEVDIQNAQTSAPGGSIVNPFSAGGFGPGTCTQPTLP
jgi:hypothetical protein